MPLRSEGGPGWTASKIRSAVASNEIAAAVTPSSVLSCGLVTQWSQDGAVPPKRITVQFVHRGDLLKDFLP